MRSGWIVKTLCLVALVLAVSGQQASAQDDRGEELKRMQDQLKAAQDRKNELAMENEKLHARLGELQKQLDAARANEATFAERTYHLRSTLAAWERFLDRYPVLKGRWQAFLSVDPLAAPGLPEWTDLQPPYEAPSTQTTQPVK